MPILTMAATEPGRSFPVAIPARRAGSDLNAVAGSDFSSYSRLSARVPSSLKMPGTVKRKSISSCERETTAGIAAAIGRIERATGLKVYAFPKLKEYFVEMKLAA